MFYEDKEKRVSRVLETFELFKEKPATLKEMIQLHVESIFLEGMIAGTKAKRWGNDRTA